MFAADGESPWWASGLSGFMTMFSAGTFVVWGGIAYEHGLVAVVINLCYGVAALLVGFTVAGRWKKTGISSPAEFITLRYGKKVTFFYTFSMMVMNIISAGVALYALSKILTALMPLPAGHWLADSTGNLSLTMAILIAGAVVGIYTMVGGLWAVLMTDVLQFIILNIAVLFVIPLIWQAAGGWDGLQQKVPTGFFSPTEPDSFTWFFMMGWILIHFFKIGAEWAFVQRFICVPSPLDAKKSAFLFGGLYLLSPLLWLAPALIYRGIQSEADPEQAYILACQSVLPIGMVGLMIAAMFSATASMVSSQLNVFAGALTNLFHATGSENRRLWWGRFYTGVIAIALTGIALSVPALGGARTVIVDVTKLLIVPLLAPTIWGLISPRVGASAVWLTAGISFGLGLITRFYFGMSGTVPDLMVGVVVPVIILTILQQRSPKTAATTINLEKEALSGPPSAPKESSPMPAFIVAVALALCSLLQFLLILVNPTKYHGILIAFGLVLAAISAFSFYTYKKLKYVR